MMRTKYIFTNSCQMSRQYNKTRLMKMQQQVLDNVSSVLLLVGGFLNGGIHSDFYSVLQFMPKHLCLNLTSKPRQPDQSTCKQRDSRAATAVVQFKFNFIHSAISPRGFSVHLTTKAANTLAKTYDHMCQLTTSSGHAADNV